MTPLPLQPPPPRPASLLQRLTLRGLSLPAAALYLVLLLWLIALLPGATNMHQIVGSTVLGVVFFVLLLAHTLHLCAHWSARELALIYGFLSVLGALPVAAACAAGELPPWPFIAAELGCLAAMLLYARATWRSWRSAVRRPRG